MSVLVDTCALSEVRRAKGSSRVRSRLAAIRDDDFLLSVITIAEIVRGIALLPNDERRVSLDRWVRAIEEKHADRILPIDLPVSRIWGELAAAARRTGVTLPAADGLIAATALRHNLAVMTRNTTDFRATGVRLVDPWEDDEEH